MPQHWRPGTFSRRAAAYAIDSVVVCVAWFIVLVVVVIIEDAFGVAGEDDETTTVEAIFMLATPVLWLAYQWLCNGIGVSPGKQLMSLRIVAPGVGWPYTTGSIPRSRPGAVRGLFRALGQALGVIALGFGFWWALWDRENRTLHDRLAGTWVVHFASGPVLLHEQPELPLLRAPRRLRFRYAGSAVTDEYVELQHDAVRIESAAGRTDLPYDGITRLAVADGGDVRLYFEEDVFGKQVESSRSFPAPEDIETFVSELELRVHMARGEPLPIER